MRRFIRHPTDIPIDFQLAGMDVGTHETLKDYGKGGLCFIADSWVEPDSEINLAISILQPAFHATATVVWCKSIDRGFEVGVRFRDAETEYAMRMTEQICYIEDYKLMQEKRGRYLTGKEAAMEWIERFAGQFPN